MRILAICSLLAVASTSAVSFVCPQGPPGRVPCFISTIKALRRPAAIPPHLELVTRSLIQQATWELSRPISNAVNGLAAS